MASSEPSGADPEPLFEDRARASSFGANAARYDRSRPRYPEALIDELVAASPTNVLDVGCGTGLFGRSFVERGLPVLGVEPDPRMADLARRHGMEVDVATFEGWDPGSRRFGLLVAGQSWHWIEPELGAAKAAEVLVGGGAAVHAWNIGAMDDELTEALLAVYDRLVPGLARPTVSHRRDTSAPQPSELAFIASRAFDAPQHRDYAWEHRYTTGEWLEQLETHSDHALLGPAVRVELLAAVRGVLDARGGGFTMRYACEVTRFPRR
jgi:SAM-dependent methyltransferase